MSSKPPKNLHKTAHSQNTASTSAAGQPVFAQPQPSPDPTGFKNPVTDQSDTELAKVAPVPQPVGGAAEPILTLAQVYGSAGAAKTAAIEQAGQIVFHSVGDTGSAEGLITQSLVADKMVTDFTEANPADIPSFFYHLGDVVFISEKLLTITISFTSRIAVIPRRFWPSQAITMEWSTRPTLRRHSRPSWPTSAPPASRHRPMLEDWRVPP